MFDTVEINDCFHVDFSETVDGDNTCLHCGLTWNESDTRDGFTRVESSLVRSLRYALYDAQTARSAIVDASPDTLLGSLDVEWIAGNITRYHAVPLTVYSAVISADSVGKTLCALVRNAGFEFNNVSFN